MPTTPLPRRRSRRLVTRTLGTLVPLGLLAAIASTQATTASVTAPAPAEETRAVAASAVYGRWAAHPSNPTNPLADRTWGVYKGGQEQAWEPYLRSTGTERELLAKIALRPKSKWYGAWISPSQIAEKVRSHITNAQAGDPNALVQLTTFALKPWEHAACKQLPTAAQKTFYRSWVQSFARGIGNAHVALVLQADGPFALCAPGGSTVYSDLIKESAKVLSALPNTAVYIDAGAADWMRDSTDKGATLLLRAGVQYTRGFALNSTHYSGTGREVRYGTALAQELERRGYPGKRFIVNTSSNGRGFPGYTYKGSNYDNARVCSSSTDTQCVTLGIPPTMDVDNPRWGLSETTAAKAARWCDGFMWFGRPWLYMQADPFLKDRALQLVRTSPFN